jgi:hypothetical protein
MATTRLAHTRLLAFHRAMSGESLYRTGDAALPVATLVKVSIHDELT